MEASPRLRVLVLDDEPITRKVVGRCLARRGYEALETSTVDEAIAALRTGRVDAVILDVRLPEERTGLDVLRELRTLPAMASVPVIMLTGAVLTDAEECVIARNRSFLFRKPESLDVLMNFLDQLLGTDQPQ